MNEVLVLSESHINAVANCLTVRGEELQRSLLNQCQNLCFESLTDFDWKVKVCCVMEIAFLLYYNSLMNRATTFFLHLTVGNGKQFVVLLRRNPAGARSSNYKIRARTKHFFRKWKDQIRAYS